MCGVGALPPMVMLASPKSNTPIGATQCEFVIRGLKAVPDSAALSTACWILVASRHVVNCQAALAAEESFCCSVEIDLFDWCSPGLASVEYAHPTYHLHRDRLDNVGSHNRNATATRSVDTRLCVNSSVFRKRQSRRLDSLDAQ